MSRKFTTWTSFMKRENGICYSMIAKDYRVVRELPVLPGCRTITETVIETFNRKGWGLINKGKFLRKALPCEWTSAHDELVRRHEFKGYGVCLYDPS